MHRAAPACSSRPDNWDDKISSDFKSMSRLPYFRYCLNLSSIREKPKLIKTFCPLGQKVLRRQVDTTHLAEYNPLLLKDLAFDCFLFDPDFIL